MKLSNVNLLALSKSISTHAMKTIRPAVEPGRYEIEFTCRVKGEMVVGQDYEQRIVNKVDLWAILAVALSKVNSTTMASIIREADEMDAESVKEVKEQAMAAIESLKGRTLTMCQGRVSSSLIVEATSRAGAQEIEAVGA